MTEPTHRHTPCAICGDRPDDTQAELAQAHQTLDWFREEKAALRQEIERLRGALKETDDCAVKHCEQPATLGMTIIESGLRVELYLCEAHFDTLAALEPTND